MSEPAFQTSRDRVIGEYSFDEFLDMAKSFHGYAAPGVILGGFMVDFALRKLPDNILFDAVSETGNCLPDAIQMLTPCTTGNGWLKVFHLGRYALSFYDKYQGDGIRVYVDPKKTEAFPAIREWFYKLVSKKQQDSELLMAQIREAGASICSFQTIRIQPQYLQKHHKGAIDTCPLCGEAYPKEHGRICRGCQGQSPYIIPSSENALFESPLRSVPSEQAVGQTSLHDMTEIVPDENKKGPAFRKGHVIEAGDLCQLHRMGKRHVYVEDGKSLGNDWIHENDAALAFAKAMAGQNVGYTDQPSEGKVNFKALRDGMILVDAGQLEAFNNIPGVMCATRKSYSLITEGRQFAGTRAIPLYLPKVNFEKAMQVIGQAPLFHIKPLRKAKVGILVTGTEVFLGLIQDRFIPIIRAKTEKIGCSVVHSKIVPDERDAISSGIRELLNAGADLIVTTAGLSVDPDDVTRQGLSDAGAADMLYGAPILPGAMTLLARIGNVQVIGVPACALFFKTTSFDLLLPRLLADIPITRADLAVMGHGAFCLECKSCSFPKCPFGK